MTGQTISHYRILEKLGEGGMGVVYKAEDTSLRRTVALKFLPPNTDEHRQRFLREAQAAASLNHPHICVIYEIDQEHWFLAMELIDGESVREKVARRPLPFEEALNLAIQAARGLQAAHEKGIVHRDIKSGNLMVDQHGQVKVTDFGLAQIGDRTRLTKSGASLGTPAYMSPEQAQGQETDRRMDIWSLGVVLYEMIAGRPPFHGETEAAVSYAIVHTPPEPLTALRAGLPLELDRVVSRALAKDPAERYQHIDEFAGELHRISKRIAGTPKTEPVRRAGLTWAVLALLLAVIAAQGILLLRRPASNTEVIEFQIPASVGGPFSSEIPSVSPDGSKIVYWADGRLWLRGLHAAAANPLAGTEGASYHFWSPDGGSLAFFAGSQLKKIALEGGPAETISDVHFGLGGAWGANGNILIAPVNRGPLHLVLPGHPPSFVTSLDGSRAENSHRFPWFLPDGRRFLYLARSGQREQTAIYAGVVGEKGTKRLFGAQSNVVYAPAANADSGWLIFSRDGNLTAQPFDATTLELSGEPQIFAQNVYWVQPSSYAAFSVSANGRVLTYRPASFPVSQFHWFDRSGQRLSSAGPRGQFSDPALSPDGTRLAVSQPDPKTGNRDIWILELRTNLLGRLTFSPANDWAPAWSPDGRWITYTSDRTSQFALYRQPAGGTGDAEMLSQLGSQAAWFPDGRWIETNDGHDIALVSADSNRKVVPILGTEFQEGRPVISPDGKRLAYVSNESGRFEVYVRSLPEIAAVPPGKWRVSSGGGTDPRWRSDGKELYYMDLDKALFAVQTPGREEFQVSAPKPLFRTCDYTFAQTSPPKSAYVVAADGQRFLINCLAEETALSPITVVINWTQRLKR